MLAFPTSPWSIAALLIGATVLAFLVAWLRWLYEDPYPFIDGPPTSNLIMGHVRTRKLLLVYRSDFEQFPEILREEVGLVYHRWHEQYGPIYKLRGMTFYSKL